MSCIAFIPFCWRNFYASKISHNASLTIAKQNSYIYKVEFVGKPVKFVSKLIEFVSQHVQFISQLIESVKKHAMSLLHFRRNITQYQVSVDLP